MPIRMLFSNSFYELLPDAHIEGQLGSILQGQICFFHRRCSRWVHMVVPHGQPLPFYFLKQEGRVLSTCLQSLSKCCTGHYPLNGTRNGKSHQGPSFQDIVMITVVVEVKKGLVLLSVLYSYQRPKE